MSANEKSDVEKNAENNIVRPAKLLGSRHVISLLLFFCLMLGYAFRVNMSVAIVAITKNTTNSDFPVYDWNSKTQNFVSSSFFWGYVVSQIPAGQLGAMYGAKWLLTVSMFINSIFCILTVVMAEIGGAWAVIGCRIVQGLCQGFFFPSMHTLLAKWIPPSERGRLATFVYAGAQFGTVVAMPICGFLAESSIGWPSIFYIFGACGIVWSVVWAFLGSNSPADHKSIDPVEKKFIEISLDTIPDEKRVPTPWLAMFTSLPMWSLIIAHCGQNWGFWTLLTQIPTYMDKVLEFDIKKSGVTAALPYLAMWLLSFVFSALSDFIVNRKYISVVAARKLFNSIGHWIPALALIGLGYVDSSNPDLAVGLLTVAVGINAATYVGFQVNHIDLAPKHAGTMMGITNAAANVMSIIAPLIVGFIVPDGNHDVEPWRIVFFISAAIYFLFNLFFVLFGKANVQPWNNIEEYKKQESLKETNTEDNEMHM